METSSEYPNVTTGEGYAVANLDDLGDGPGFRKVRKGLDVTAFGVNAIVLPPGIETGFHYHDLQEELYFVHRGTIEMEFGDGSVQRLAEGGLARGGRLRRPRLALVERRSARACARARGTARGGRGPGRALPDAQPRTRP